MIIPMASNVDDTWAGVAFVLGIFTLATIIVVFALWWLGSTYKTRAAASRETAYRELADRATAAQIDTQDALHDMRGRLAEVERMMREVQ